MSPTQKFSAYVASLDLKIQKGVQNQNSQLSLRRKQMLEQIADVRSQQNRILEEVKKKENYFE